MFLLLSKIFDLLLAPLTWAILLAAAAWALRRRRPALGGWLAAAAAVVLLVFSCPVVADTLLRAAEASAPRTYRPDETYDAVVVLGGIMEARRPWQDDGKDLTGAAERLTRTFELLREGHARVVLFSGGDVDPVPGIPSEAEELATMLQGWGIPPERIATETRSRNTHENAVETAKVVAARGWRRLLLVTSAVNMPRSLGCFHREGLSPDALPVDYRAGAPGAAAALESWLPRSGELELSTEALRELAGRVVYRVRGYSAG